MKSGDEKSLVLLRLWIQKNFHKTVSEQELLEIRDSLFYLGRAINRYNHLKQGGFCHDKK